MHDYLKRLNYIEDPEIFEVNRLAPHSDHEVLDQDGFPLPVIDLCGEWAVECFPTPEMVDTRLISCGMPSGTIHVPGHLQLQGYGEAQYVNTQYPWDGLEQLTPPAIPKRSNLTAVYVKTFALTDAFFVGRIRLVLEGVESSCFAYLNGGFIGYSEDSFTPAAFDITLAAKIGENRLVVVVPRFCSGSWLEDQDFWRLSGIFRPVRIIAEAPIWIEDIHILPELDASLETGLIRVEMRVFSARNHTCSVQVSLEGTACATTIDGELIEGEQVLKTSLTVQRPLLWSAETPHLYACEIRLSVDGETTGWLVREMIGFRRFELCRGIMMLNGRRLILRGVNRHEWSCKTGRAVTRDDMLHDVILLKQNNFNAVRTSHYPNQSAFYALCDRYGIYVIDEVNIETHGTWMVSGKVQPTEHTLPGSLPRWEKSALARAESMFERDKNHPCILLWSSGNESYGGQTIYKISEWFRRHDSSRLVHYEGIYHDRTYEDTSDVESRMYIKPQEVRKYLEQNEKKPFLLCEYAHAMGNSFGNVDEYIALEEAFRQYQGGFIWDWIDQAIEHTDAKGRRVLRYGGDFGDRPTDWNFCGNGLLFSDRTVSPKMDEAKWLYAPYRILCDAAGVTIVNRMMFSGSESHLFEWQLLQNGIAIQNGDFTVRVPAGETVRKALALQTEQLCGELTLSCRAILAENASYAPAGHEVAYGYAVIKKPDTAQRVFYPAELIKGDVNLGVRMENASALIRKNTGMLYSLKGKEELLLSAAQADFWRAPTDNDRGSGSFKTWTIWKIASLYRDFLGMEVSEREAKAVLRYAAPTNPEIRYAIEYRFDRRNRIAIQLSLDPVQATMPCFGLSFALPSSFDRMQWYGNLAREASIDRQRSAHLGRGDAFVKDQLTPYLKPQDCGNKTLVRELTIRNKENRGIRFYADEPFEASALHFTSHELESANHIEELPPISKTVVTLYQKKRGVGGDDSWGAPVHEQYQISAEHGMKFSIWLEIL